MLPESLSVCYLLSCEWLGVAVFCAEEVVTVVEEMRGLFGLNLQRPFRRREMIRPPSCTNDKRESKRGMLRPLMISLSKSTTWKIKPPEAHRPASASSLTRLRGYLIRGIAILGAFKLVVG